MFSLKFGNFQHQRKTLMKFQTKIFFVKPYRRIKPPSSSSVYTQYAHRSLDEKSTKKNQVTCNFTFYMGTLDYQRNI